MREQACLQRDDIKDVELVKVCANSFCILVKKLNVVMS